jgi:hypothetical protein
LQHPQTGRLVWMLVCRFPVLMVDSFKLMRPLEGLAKCCIENCAIFLPLLLAPVSFISGFLSLLVFAPSFGLRGTSVAFATSVGSVLTWIQRAISFLLRWRMLEGWEIGSDDHGEHAI